MDGFLLFSLFPVLEMFWQNWVTCPVAFLYPALGWLHPQGVTMSCWPPCTSWNSVAESYSGSSLIFLARLLHNRVVFFLQLFYFSFCDVRSHWGALPRSIQSWGFAAWPCLLQPVSPGRAQKLRLSSHWLPYSCHSPPLAVKLLWWKTSSDQLFCCPGYSSYRNNRINTVFFNHQFSN